MKKGFQYSLAGLILLLAQGILAYAPDDCVRCHKTGSSESRLHVPVQTYEASIHGREITCQDCHTGVIDEEHKTVKGSGTVDCSQCHDQENRHGLKSKNKYRPQCYSCHTTHAVFEKESERSSIHEKNLNQTCKTCHPAECGQRDFMSWLPSLQISSHNKQDFGQVFDADNCVGCHQGMAAHGEDTPLNDQDCYQCHLSPKGESLLLGYIHPKGDLDKHPTIFAAGALYLVLILILFFGGFAFCIRKFLKKRTDRRG
ncbi:MAG: hypothetical protein JRL30_08935 [Deltaproteobacteria bacterium]|nr:hypothetical protein [Deltaproteobacteria bacterium]